MKAYTIGYGGRKPQEFLDLLRAHNVKAIVDVRLRPDRASMGTYARARSSEKGIQALLAKADIQYFSFVELGNVFLDFSDWEVRYRRLIDKAGDLLVERLLEAPKPFCLLCAEKHAEHCHRSIIAAYLQTKGCDTQHIE
ncbi:MAG: DUF488 domain-containing protein [Sedimentisphaerales bacterium]|jgi:uncharacterized protein (DUF488 family)